MPGSNKEAGDRQNVDSCKCILGCVFVEKSSDWIINIYLNSKEVMK